MNKSPKRLKRGDKIAIVAPASPFETNELVEGLDILKQMGLIPVLGPNVKQLKTTHIHSAPIMDRVDELNWAFSQPDIACVSAACGGVACAEVLPYLDYKMIAQSGKVFIGMSDITSLNTAILKKSGLITISGQAPSIRLDKGKIVLDADSKSLKFTYELLMSDRHWGTAPFDINQYGPRMIAPGKASGIAIGGNLDTFSRMIGTPYMCEFNNCILFIEDVHKDGEVILRQLVHMRLAGILDNVAGVVIGEFYDVPKHNMDINVNNRNPSIEDVLLEYFADGPPCVYGYSFSHGDFTIPIPIGSQCSIDADSGIVSFKFKMS
jgi:muramoyltetrapeptide carboxypeptidase